MSKWYTEDVLVLVGAVLVIAGIAYAGLMQYRCVSSCVGQEKICAQADLLTGKFVCAKPNYVEIGE